MWGRSSIGGGFTLTGAIKKTSSSMPSTKPGATFVFVEIVEHVRVIDGDLSAVPLGVASREAQTSLGNRLRLSFGRVSQQREPGGDVNP